MLEKQETPLKDCFLLKPKIFKDNRGSLTKIFHQPTFENLGLSGKFTEEYFSLSKKNVLRGLHFQTPPNDHIKVVTCLSGKLYDVVLDLRKNSPTYGKHFGLLLDSEDPTIIYIPSGFAHGFLSLEDNSLFLNKTTTVYDPQSDGGIRWDSCGIDWPNLYPIVSQKDKDMPAFSSYYSPF